jgi:hypothetical protein
MTQTVIRCVHRQLAERTHEFVLMEVSIFAIAEVFDTVDKIMREVPYPHNIDFLVDSRVGTQPIGYCFTRIREMAKKYPKREPSRMAFIIDPDNPFVRMFDIFMRRFGSVRFFAPDQRDEAIAWLLNR